MERLMTYSSIGMHLGFSSMRTLESCLSSITTNILKRSQKDITIYRFRSESEAVNPLKDGLSPFQTTTKLRPFFLKRRRCEYEKWFILTVKENKKVIKTPNRCPEVLNMSIFYILFRFIARFYFPQALLSGTWNSYFLFKPSLHELHLGEAILVVARQC